MPVEERARILCGGRRWEEEVVQVMGRRDGGCLGLAATGYAIKEGDTPQSAIRVDGMRALAFRDSTVILI
jgi:hypothetical protein